MITLFDNIASIHKYVSKSEDIAKYLIDFAVYKPWLICADGKLYVANAYLQDNRK